jgi:hypothetical protein
MASRPIIQIEVDSEPFQRFKRLFDQYSKDVKSVNAEWKAMAANSNTALAPLAAYADKASKAHERLSVAIHGTGKAMSGLLKTTQSFAHTVEGIAKTLMKWTAITAGAGLFGLDQLANMTLERGKSAAGMGVTTGQQAAFRVNMKALLGSPDQALAAAANAQVDYSKWGALASMGILNPQGQSPFDLELQIQRRARAIWKQNPNVQMAQAYGLTDFFSIEDLRRMGAMSDKDFNATQAATRRDVTALGFGAQQTKEWTQLSIQMSRAGAEIEKVLVNGLARLAPDLEKLSAAAVHLIDEFFKSDEAKKAIDALAVGINDFATEIKKPEFIKGIRDFVDGAEYAGKKIVDAMKWLGAIPGTADNAADKAKGAIAGAVVGGAIAGPLGAAAGAAAGSALTDPKGGGIDWGKLGDKNRANSWWNGNLGNWWNNLDLGKLFKESATSAGLPSDFLLKTAFVESGGNPFAMSKAGAEGLMQLMPGTARQYGVDPFNPSQSISAAGEIYRHLLSKYGGRLDMSAAAYNWGEGNLDRDIARYGANWRSHLPRETEQYLDKLGVGGNGENTNLLRSLLRVTKTRAANPQPVNLQVQNSTSSQVAILANSAIGI